MTLLNVPAIDPHHVQDHLVAIGIRETDTNQRHVAILYESANGAVRLSHLLWHLRWNDEPYDGLYFWAQLRDLEAEERPAIIAFLSALPHLRPHIPFGFRTAGCTFTIDPATSTVSFQAGEPGTGLTCATFVTLVFTTLSIPLVLESTWEARPDDEVWQRKVIDLLRQQRVAPTHLSAIESTVGAVRIRPEEVAAAATHSDLPIDFGTAHEIAQQVVAELAAS